MNIISNTNAEIIVMETIPPNEEYVTWSFERYFKSDPDKVRWDSCKLIVNI